ncbi:MAG: 5-dehydro-2-deoxygluconokinase [Granulosicoccus sp.]
MSDVEPSIDLVCLGRAGVDLYADQIGARLEDVSSLSKYIGGSSTNIACCSSRMGLSTALITRVGNEHMGQFIREQLQREGVDTRNVLTDPDRLTALVVLGIKDQDTFPLIFYRENCADMAISVDDLDAELISNAKALLITGTHFSTESIYKTSKAALAIARNAGVKTAIDIDYRPVLWGLTSKGDGETRFIANDAVSKHLQGILSEFDLIVGTEEEIHIAGGSTDTSTALKTIREISSGVIVLKRGPFGATVFDGPIPDSIDDGITVKGVQVEVLNVLGAGDAFVSGFLRGWLSNEGYEQALRYANACGALVVSRHGCTPAMPTREELDYFLDNAPSIPRPDVDTELNYLHRVTTRPSRWDSVLIHAFDHRQQLEVMADEAGVTREHISALKDLLFKATEQVTETKQIQGQAGLLCDGIYGQRVLNAATGTGTWIARPVEQPKTRPLLFEHGASVGSLIHSWPREHIIKCLFFYSLSDSDTIRLQQEQRMLELYHACCQSGHEMLLEIIPSPEDTLEVGDSVCRSAERVYDLGIRPDWWKVPCMSRAHAQQLEQLIDYRAPHCQGIVVLGLDAPLDELGAGFKAFAGLQRVKGFAVGRSIFGEASKAWLSGSINDEELVAQVAANYSKVIDLWQAR